MKGMAWWQEHETAGASTVKKPRKENYGFTSLSPFLSILRPSPWNDVYCIWGELELITTEAQTCAPGKIIRYYIHFCAIFDQVSPGIHVLEVSSV